MPSFDCSFILYKTKKNFNPLFLIFLTFSFQLFPFPLLYLSFHNSHFFIFRSNGGDFVCTLPLFLFVLALLFVLYSLLVFLYSLFYILFLLGVLFVSYILIIIILYPFLYFFLFLYYYYLYIKEMHSSAVF